MSDKSATDEQTITDHITDEQIKNEAKKALDYFFEIMFQAFEKYKISKRENTKIK